MLIRYDRETDTKYITLLHEEQKSGVVTRTEKVEPWLLVDYDERGEVFGIEVLDASKNQVTLVVTEEGIACFPAPKSVISEITSLSPAEAFNEPAEELSLSL